MKLLFYLVLALSLAACNDEVPKTQKLAGQLTFNDFETVDGWASGTPIPSLTSEKAHSGTFAVKVAPGIDYSLGYNNLLGKVGGNKLRKLRVQAWVFVPNAQSSAVLVTQLRDEAAQKDLMWEGLSLSKEAKEVNRWVKVEKVVTLPETATYNNRLLVYLWRNNSSQPAYLDDLQLSWAD
ncbi:carbohydrate binding domain-containing protein [Hymenobacter terricola]|uniref:hypothetical protein n=1 Tax=Hymenobacter terricola TaxID=2819236 RepID=UPI001B30CE9B|nr:hypothetical protein [Hymenobacter terricola]